MDCDIFITHAGIGGIASGVGAGKHMVVMPRLAKFGEHRNDHQMATAASLREIPVVNSSDELLIAVRGFTSQARPAAAGSSLNLEFGEKLMDHIQGLA